MPISTQTALHTQTVGRMGELVVELALLSRGWQVGNFNASTGNSASWDVFAAGFGSAIKLRVKAKRPGTDCFRWSAKADGSVLLGLQDDDPCDFVAAVSLADERGDDRIYLVPAVVVERELVENHTAWLAVPKANGEPRKNTNMRNLHLDGSVDRLGHGYEKAWEKYLSNWQFLQQ